MSMTPEEARAALAEIGQTETRGRTAHAYQATSTILILWGAIWVVGYAAMGLLPMPGAAWVWLPGNLVGVAGTFWLGRRSGKIGSFGPAATVAVGAVLFVTGVFTIDPPHSAVQIEALPPLVVALLYVVLGAERMPRLPVIGVVLFVATMLGALAWPAHFALWMAAAGGGALVAGGLWLRRV